jgi:hypothetical protein
MIPALADDIRTVRYIRQAAEICKVLDFIILEILK